MSSDPKILTEFEDPPATTPQLVPPEIWLPPIPFLQAKNFTRPGIWTPRGFVYQPRETIDLPTFHCMEAPEKGTTAKSVGNYFAGLYGPAPKASAHVGIDPDGIVEYVKEQDIAWHAKGANGNGYGIELAGFAKQTRLDWLDNTSLLILEYACRLSAILALKHGIPMVALSVDELKYTRPRGFTTHAMVNKAYNPGETHWDPGPGFPMDLVMARINTIARIGAPQPMDGGPKLKLIDVGPELLLG